MLGIHAPRRGRVACRRRAAGAGRACARWREHGRHGDAGRRSCSRARSPTTSASSTPRRTCSGSTECARMAAVHDEIEAMPMGYHTLIGDMGAAASRAGRSSASCWPARCTSGRSILLLDEATSALDVERERIVNQAGAPAGTDARDRRAPARDDRQRVGRVIVLQRGPGGAGPAHRAASGRGIGSGSSSSAGAEAEHGVQRAVAERRGGEQDDADPAPQADGAGEREGDQHQAEQGAQGAVDVPTLVFMVRTPLNGRRGRVAVPASVQAASRRRR